jgi:hypothetical protein
MPPGAVAKACNPIYSEGGDQEDHSLKPSWAKSLQDPISTSKSWTWCYVPAIPVHRKHRKIVVQAVLGIE